MTPFQSTHNEEKPLWEGKKREEHPEKLLPPLTVPSTEHFHIGSRWRQLLKLMTRTTVRGNVQPPIGQLCIIMTGVAGQDAGQMGVVTHHNKVMVEVTFAARAGKGTTTKTKQPRSLVLLEPGLIMVQDINGSVWIRSAVQDGPKQMMGTNGQERGHSRN
jgi:hypothetical protein